MTILGMIHHQETQDHIMIILHREVQTLPLVVQAIRSNMIPTVMIWDVFN